MTKDRQPGTMKGRDRTHHGKQKAETFTGESTVKVNEKQAGLAKGKQSKVECWLVLRKWEMMNW